MDPPSSTMKKHLFRFLLTPLSVVATLLVATAMTTNLGQTAGWTLARPFVSVFSSKMEVHPSSGIAVIGAGPGGIGTSSLSVALKMLGYRPYHMKDSFVLGHAGIWQRALDSGSVDEAVSVLLELGYDAILDEPGSAFVPQLADKFPDAKIILTHRDVTSWMESVKKLAMLQTQIGMPPFKFIPALQQHFSTVSNAIFRRRGCSIQNLLDDDIDGTCVKWYYEHMAQVQQLFSDQGDRLLNYQVTEGWEPLASFLNVTECPSDPFPQSNQGGDVGRALTLMKIISILFTFLPAIVIGVLISMLTQSTKESDRNFPPLDDDKIPRIRGMCAVVPGIDGVPGGNVPTTAICRTLRNLGVHNPKNGKVISDNWAERNLHIPSIAVGRLDLARLLFKPTEEEVPSSLPSISEEEMSYRAFDEAVRKAKVNVEDIDAMIYVSCTAKDVHFNEGLRHWYRRYPKLSKRLKLLYLPFGCPALVHALGLAQTMLHSQNVKNVAIVISNGTSSFFAEDALKPYTRDNNMRLWLNVCVFGDAAFACIVSQSQENMPSRTYKIKFSDIVCDPEVFITSRQYVASGSKISDVFVLNPEGPQEIPKSLRYWFSVLKNRFGYGVQSFQHMVFHQANPKVIRMVCERFNCTDKTSVVGEKYGNLGPTSVGCALYDRLEQSSDLPKDGDLVLGYALGALTGNSHGIFVLECEVRN